jgi:threonine/homoserine/homoserine lactone efflux protein
MLEPLTAWFPLAGICLLGAMSPGPSLAVVVRNTLADGLGAGLWTAWSHALGVGLYALGTAGGLGLVIVGSPALFDAIRLAGGGFLVYLGAQLWLSSPPPARRVVAEGATRGARDGFLIAFLNPKIALFFLALFSQFVRPEADWVERGVLALTALVIDGCWYTVVALGLSTGRRTGWLEDRRRIIDRLFGALLLGLAGYVLIDAVS